MAFQVGDKVWFRGKFATYHSWRGVIESVVPESARPYGVALEIDVAFSWCDESQLLPREEWQTESPEEV